MSREREGVTRVSHGVLRMQRAGVNCYLIEAEDGLTLVDAGLPGMWRLLLRALRMVGASPVDLSAIILTHGHFDHVGMSGRLHRHHGVRSLVHASDERLASHPYRYDHESPRWRYPLRHPRALPLQLDMLAAGALRVEGVTAKPCVRTGSVVDVPGAPIAIASPGHTDGHHGFLLPEEGILFTGDALVTLDPYSGRTGPRIVARAATADVAANQRSLSAYADTGARLVLPGHGSPFPGGAARAVAQALAQPVA